MTVIVSAPMNDPFSSRMFCNQIGNLSALSVLRRIAAWVLGGLMMVMMHPALADEPVELGDILIEAAIATPGAKGSRSKIRFRIINNSRTDLHLIGISTPMAEKVELIARVGAKKTSVLQSFGIPSEETLDLTTSHLHFEIYPLLEALQSGDEFPITLHFVGWSKNTLMHVH